jgi:riboflavin kinase/FMN adenylyltransferase
MGKVITGRGKGRQLGFATANMEKPEQVVPAEGVYVGYVQLADSQQELCETTENIPAVFSIGQTSTFGQGYPLLIEAHLLKQGVGELAGKWMAMDFIDFIRSQHKFPSQEALIAQIKKDIAHARGILNKDGF